MKGKNGKKILKLFDYFKIAFETNIHHKELYKPQIIYLLLRGLLIFLSGLTLVDLSTKMAPFVGTVSFSRFFSLMWGEFLGTPLLLVAVTMIVMLFGSTYVEAGLYYMYDKLLEDGRSEPVFATGANRYFLSFLAGNILIGLFWLVAALPYILLGLITLTLGFIWIPIIISALLMVWKASVVCDQAGVFTAIGSSLSFGKRHFVPANVFIIIRTALTNMGGGGSGNGGSSNYSSSFNDFKGNFNAGPFNGPSGRMPGADWFRFGEGFNIFKAIFTGIIGLISIVTVVAGMIHMLFEIFFGLTTVIIYRDDWYVEEDIEADKHSDDAKDTDYMSYFDTTADEEKDIATT